MSVFFPAQLSMPPWVLPSHPQQAAGWCTRDYSLHPPPCPSLGLLWVPSRSPGPRLHNKVRPSPSVQDPSESQGHPVPTTVPSLLPALTPRPQINKSVSGSSLSTICSPWWSPGSLPGWLQAPRSEKGSYFGTICLRGASGWGSTTEGGCPGSGWLSGGGSN